MEKLDDPWSVGWWIDRVSIQRSIGTRPGLWKSKACVSAIMLVILRVSAVIINYNSLLK